MKPLSSYHQGRIDHAFRRVAKIKALGEQRGRCRYCYERISRSKATADHMHPRSKGGTDDFDNIVAVCEPCNSAKGSKSVNEFMKLVKKPEHYRGAFFYAHLRRRLNLRIERAERRILASVGLPPGAPPSARPRARAVHESAGFPPAEPAAREGSL